MIRWMLLIVVLLAGCKHNGNSPPSGDDQDPIFYPFKPDYTTTEGMEVELRGHSPEVIEENADRWYAETQQCVADWFAILYPSKEFMFFDPPPVIIEIDPESICGDFDGFVNGIYCANYAIPIMVIRGGATYNFGNHWKHEFIHHILLMNDFDQQMSLNHKPDEIWNNCQI